MLYDNIKITLVIGNNQARRQDFISGLRQDLGVATNKSLGDRNEQDNFSMSGTSACKKLKYIKAAIENFQKLILSIKICIAGQKSTNC